ncbi:bacterio-opsin activator domain-containing protein [Halorussus sp. AFM4]|uniref:bacterio-opsin activator domain-containing protein n=1 Tax=Halorussus sp. AFM4 TaxID=3421651 RepID=UPI003EBC1949
MSDVESNEERALDALVDRVAVLDASGTILRTNRAWDEFAAEHGVGSAAGPGADYLSAAGAGDDEFADAARAGIRAVLDGEREAFTMEYPCHGERERWFRLRASRFDADDGPRAVVSHTDVTESRLAGDELRKNERALRALYDVATERDADFDAKLERIIELGCERVDLPLGFLTYIDPDRDRQEIVAARGDHDLLRAGETEALSRAYCRRTIESDGLLGVRDAPAEGWTGDPAYERFELACYLGGKVTVDGELYGTLCFADTDPRDRAFTPSERAFVEVLTQWVSFELERRERERELRREREFIRSVVDALPDPLYAFDLEGNPLRWNDRAVEVTGYDDERFEETELPEFLAPEDRERVGATVDRILGEGTAETVEADLLTASGETVPYEFSGAPLAGGDGERLGFVGVGRDVTERKRAEREAERNAERLRRERERLERVLDRVNGLLRDVAEVLVQATTREEIERGVCRRLVETDPYRFAWVGGTDLRRETAVARRWAGEGPDVEGLELDLDDPTDPCAAAVATGEVRTSVDPDGDDLAPDHAAALADAGDVSALVAVPLAYRDTVYGVLAVYAADPDAFDERERLVLETLGVEIANAVNALESGRILTADRVVELDLDVRGDLSAGDVAAAGDCRLSYVASTTLADGRLRQLWTAETADPEAVVAAAEASDRVGSVRRLTERDGDCLFEFVVADSFVAELADYGAVTRAIEADPDRTRLALELPNETAARSVFETVAERFREVDLAGFRERERPARTRQEFAAAVADRLTDRQATALKRAYFAGFFEWPRPTTGDDLAASMDVARPTFHQHLRAAQRKLLAELFEGRRGEPN